MRFYKGPKAGHSSPEYEVQLKAEFDRLKFLANYRKLDEKVTLSDICEYPALALVFAQLYRVAYFILVNRPALMGILNGSVLAALACMTGFLVFATYAVVIFEEAGAKYINPYNSAIVMAMLQLIGNFCTASLSDSIGRKTLMVFSLLGAACGMFIFSFHCYLRWIGYDMLDFEFVPIASLFFAAFISSAGVVPLMFVGMVEYMPFQVRIDKTQLLIH